MLFLPMASKLGNGSLPPIIPTSKLCTVQVAALDEYCCIFWYKDALQMYKKTHLENMSEECSVKEDSISSQMSDLVRNFNCVQ